MGAINNVDGKVAINDIDGNRAGFFEVFYGSGGMSGPFYTLKDAQDHAVKYLLGRELEKVIRIVEYDKRTGESIPALKLLKIGKHHERVIAENDDYEIAARLP